MRLHVDAVGRLHLLWGGLGVLTGGAICILALGTHLALTIGRRSEMASVGFLFGIAVLLVAGGVAQIVAGNGIRRRAAIGRSAALALAVPNLLLLPFGTALGVYTLWIMLNDEARREFGVPVTARVPAP